MTDAAPTLRHRLFAAFDVVLITATVIGVALPLLALAIFCPKA